MTEKNAPTPAGKPATPVTPAKSLLEKITAQVASMSKEQVAAQLAKIKAARAKQTAKRGELTPEQKAKRTAYNKERMKRPEVKEKMLAYRKSPEAVARRKAYSKQRAEKIKLLVARAKELGIVV